MTNHELGQHSQTDIYCAFAGLDGEPIHVAKGPRCTWTCELQPLRNMRCEVARIITVKYDE
jgi:hypothetical protein